MITDNNQTPKSKTDVAIAMVVTSIALLLYCVLHVLYCHGQFLWWVKKLYWYIGATANKALLQQSLLVWSLVFPVGLALVTGSVFARGKKGSLYWFLWVASLFLCGLNIFVVNRIMTN